MEVFSQASKADQSCATPFPVRDPYSLYSGSTSDVFQASVPPDFGNDVLDASNAHGEVTLLIFLIIFLSIFPVVIPFILMRNTVLPGRVSRTISMVMSFRIGYAYDHDTAHRP